MLSEARSEAVYLAHGSRMLTSMTALESAFPRWSTLRPLEQPKLLYCTSTYVPSVLLVKKSNLVDIVVQWLVMTGSIDWVIAA
jgi:hypothetical protein